MRTHVYVVVSHDNRFRGVFGTPAEAKAEADQYRDSYVMEEPVEFATPPSLVNHRCEEG